MITRVLVGGAIIKDNKVLLLKRTQDKKFLPGYYDVPGGKVDPGEDPNDTIIREVKEETDLDVEIVRPYNVWSTILEFNNKKEHVIEIDYLLRIKQSKEIKLSQEEHCEFIWVDKSTIPSKISPELKATVIKALDEL